MRFLLIILLGLFSQVGHTQENNKAIVKAINQNNTNAIFQYFGSDTDVTVLDDNKSGETGKTLVSKFFGGNKVSSFIIKHEGTSKSGNTYQIGDLTTSTGNYRVTYFTKKTSSGVEIIQFKIEEN